MKCPICQYSAKSVLDYVKHTAVHNLVSSKKKISCPHCPTVCGSRSVFLVHLKTHKNTKSEEPLSEGENHSIYCKHCGNIFSTLKIYEEHIKEIPLGSEIACPYCHITKTSFSAYKVHKSRYHRSDKTFASIPKTDSTEHHYETLDFDDFQPGMPTTAILHLSESFDTPERSQVFFWGGGG